MGVVELDQAGTDVVDQVGLGEHEDRVGTSVRRQRLPALDATGERTVQPADEEHEVEVGGQQLVVVAARGPAPQERRTREEGRHLFAVDHEPVAHRQRVDAASQLHRAIPGGSAHLHGHAVVSQHATWLRVRAMLRRAARPNDRSNRCR